MKIKDIIKKKYRIRPKSLYAVTAGDYLGKFLLFIDTTPINGMYNVLAIGQGRELSSDGFEVMLIPEKDVTDALKHKILDFVSALPKDDTYNILYKEWESRKQKELNDEFDYRCEQPDASSSLGK
jgi:hypothetical protein